LVTVDGNHLSRASAERWSTRFVALLGVVLDRCLRAKAAQAGQFRVWECNKAEPLTVRLTVNNSPLFLTMFSFRSINTCPASI